MGHEPQTEVRFETRGSNDSKSMCRHVSTHEGRIGSEDVDVNVKINHPFLRWQDKRPERRIHSLHAITCTHRIQTETGAQTIIHDKTCDRKEGERNR